MKWFVFKTPRKHGDRPVEVKEYEPMVTQIELYAQRYGPIVVVSEEQLDKERKGNL